MINTRNKKYVGYFYGKDLNEYGVNILDNLSDGEIDLITNITRIKAKHDIKFHFIHNGLCFECEGEYNKNSYNANIIRIS